MSDDVLITKKLRTENCMLFPEPSSLQFFILLHMEMGASNKKRKLACREEDEEDEAKMETFFALVRNIRDTRDRWMGLMSCDANSNRGKNKIITAKEDNHNTVGVWKPTFQLEDFADDQASQPSFALSAAASQTKNTRKEEVSERGIDLKLSL
ncbi:hypothetical protein VNO78_20633 [Psophocarpus tetragonolobus]|uniref:Uncharacterized protein n=1 Tax=Psophocarpus tetragonolobus TaxID=3891 RepID=A0AAN9S9K0_PSOTE